eukprot:5927299-Amphidinium_carterae.1
MDSSAGFCAHTAPSLPCSADPLLTAAPFCMEAVSRTAMGMARTAFLEPGPGTAFHLQQSFPTASKIMEQQLVTDPFWEECHRSKKELCLAVVLWLIVMACVLWP